MHSHATRACTGNFLCCCPHQEKRKHASYGRVYGQIECLRISPDPPKVLIVETSQDDEMERTEVGDAGRGSPGQKKVRRERTWRPRWTLTGQRRQKDVIFFSDLHSVRRIDVLVFIALLPRVGPAMLVRVVLQGQMPR